MFQHPKRFFIIAVAASLITAPSSAAAPSLTLGSILGQVGTTVTLPVTFNPGTSAVSALQFTLTLPSALSAGIVKPGAVAGTASKIVESNPVGTTLNVIVYGGNAAISAGTLMTIQLSIARDAALAPLNLPVSGVVYVDPNANAVPVGTSTNGTVTVTLSPVNQAPIVNADLNAVKVYPNPWRSGKDSGHGITFDNVPAQATLKIFTVSGHQVYSATALGTSVTWNLTNDNGDRAASGLYMYLVTANGQKTRGKLAIIR